MSASTCDTSLLVAALVSWHPDHREARAAIMDSVTMVPAHALVECYSVLTRLPAPHRIAPDDAAGVIGAVGLTPVTLPADDHADVIGMCASHGIAGGAVYDALIAATAMHHGLRLLTRDRRARATYDAVGVQSAYV